MTILYYKLVFLLLCTRDGVLFYLLPCSKLWICQILKYTVSTEMDYKSKRTSIDKGDHHIQKILKTHIVVGNQNHSKATPDINDGQAQKSNESVTASTVFTPISQRIESDLSFTDDNDNEETNDTGSAENASYVSNVIAWNCDPTIPVSYYWKNEKSLHCMDKTALPEDSNGSKKYQSSHL
ncbi:uncharacterized protein LOC132936836 isoform X2 [Metopolophium dirhodum]|uniref:uncharacterized protein LOC132936836 isoform X2 n=1 Tax=Metopolophium dirhodum TaxID=44670 RepID=UPI00298FDD83|nr:uncharacterized protein LOC132936836 isoform X2 [Metopolophium dirhodum]